MAEYTLGAVESRFANLIWDRQPLTSSQLVKLCEEELSWKKSTTYTIMRRLCQRGIFQNEGGVVSALMSREEFYARQSEEFVAESFDGSLPRFLAAFAGRRELSDEEIDQLQQFINERRG